MMYIEENTLQAQMRAKLPVQLSVLVETITHEAELEKIDQTRLAAAICIANATSLPKTRSKRNASLYHPYQHTQIPLPLLTAQ